jgi:hypothetical protein
MITLHMGGVPEMAMFLGPILLIIAFIRIARRNDATAVDDEDDWDADLGDLDDHQDPTQVPARRQMLKEIGETSEISAETTADGAGCSRQAR